MALFAGNWSKILYCLMLAVSLVIVCQLLVTGFSGEGTENGPYEAAPKGYFTTYMVEHKVKRIEFWVQQEPVWAFMGCWALSGLTGMCCHSDCLGHSKAVSKSLSLDWFSQSSVTCISQMYIESLLLFLIPWFPQEGNWEKRSKGSCTVLPSELWSGWLTLQMTEQQVHGLYIVPVNSAPTYFEIIWFSSEVNPVCCMWCLKSS